MTTNRCIPVKNTLGRSAVVFYACELVQLFSVVFCVGRAVRTRSFRLVIQETRWAGIATRYGLDGPGIESRWGRIFRTRPNRPWGLPNLLYNGYRVFPGGKAAGAWRWPPTPHLAPRLKRRATHLLPLWAFVACSRVTFIQETCNKWRPVDGRQCTVTEIHVFDRIYIFSNDRASQLHSPE